MMGIAGPGRRLTTATLSMDTLRTVETVLGELGLTLSTVLKVS